MSRTLTDWDQDPFEGLLFDHDFDVVRLIGPFVDGELAGRGGDDVGGVAQSVGSPSRDPGL